MGKRTRVSSILPRALVPVFAALSLSAIVSNLLSPFVEKVSWIVWTGELGLIVLLGAAVSASLRRTRRWPSLAWIAGFACLLWVAGWGLASVHLSSVPLARHFVPRSYWIWQRWALPAGIVGGAGLMAAALRVRKR